MKDFVIRKFARHVLLVTVFIVVALYQDISWAAFEQENGQFIDESTGKTLEFSLFSADGRYYIETMHIPRLLPCTVDRDVISRRYAIGFEQGTIRFQGEEPYLIVNDSIIHLYPRMREEGGYVYLPLDGFVKAVNLLGNLEMSWNETQKVITVRKKLQKEQTSPLPEKSEMLRDAALSSPRKVRSVTIDPGHGGKDSGAIGPAGVQEKDVVLQISKLLKSELRSKLGIDVFLTRDDDTFLPIEDRTSFANNHGSDFFISLHTNSVKRSNTEGFEVYYLNRQPSDDQAMETALLENLSAGSAITPQEMGDDVQSILWDLIQDKYLEESSILAEKILNSHERAFNRRSRGVKQAPFIVLIGAEMPAVLVEIDFISNPSREKQMMDRNYQEKIVNALVQGILEYKRHYEKVIGTDSPSFESGSN